MALVTVSEIKSEIKTYTYSNLTGDDDTVTERAISKARAWADAKLAQVDLDTDFDESGNTVDHQIVLKRALYELYAYGEMEEVATDKKDDAFELLRAKYGSKIDETNQPSATGAAGSSGASSPSGQINVPERNTDAF